MTTPITLSSIARLAAPVLVAGALAAGCGTVAANPGGPNKPAADLPVVSASASGSGSGSGSGSAPPAGAHATPVPTVTGGPALIVGGAACSGWPADAPHGTLTAMFTPVAVERCVTSFQQIAGKGEWETATLERSTDRLATLTAALMQPSRGNKPDVMCPEFVILPPQIVLFNSTGEELIPRLPVGACGAVDTQVLSTLAAMTWQPVSVRLVAKIDPVVAAEDVPRRLPRPGLAQGAAHRRRLRGRERDARAVTDPRAAPSTAGGDARRGYADVHGGAGGYLRLGRDADTVGRRGPRGAVAAGVRVALPG